MQPRIMKVSRSCVPELQVRTDSQRVWMAWPVDVDASHSTGFAPIICQENDMEGQVETLETT